MIVPHGVNILRVKIVDHYNKSAKKTKKNRHHHNLFSPPQFIIIIFDTNTLIKTTHKI